MHIIKLFHNKIVPIYKLTVYIGLEMSSAPITLMLIHKMT